MEKRQFTSLKMGIVLVALALGVVIFDACQDSAGDKHNESSVTGGTAATPRSNSQFEI